jgi:hypothetical protein
MKRTRWPNLLLVVAGLAAGLAAAELALRLAAGPSAGGHARTLGVDLPPFPLIASPPRGPQASRPAALPAGAPALSEGDLDGVLREDPVLGYAPLEGAVSAHRWWRTDGLGARRDGRLAPTPPPGTRRLLVFGDSFAAGSRVPQEDAWTTVLERTTAGLEVAGFGVDGYGTAQSALRHASLAPRLRHHAVILVVSPWADLWRDVNTLRRLGEGWSSTKLMPRMALRRGSLVTIASPWTDAASFVRDNTPHPSPSLRAHLRDWDRFYDPRIHEPPRGLSRAFAARLVAAWSGARRRDAVRRETLLPGSEAALVTAAAIRSMRDGAASRGASFALVLLPGEVDLRMLAEERGYRRRWKALRGALCGTDVACVDLEPALSRRRDRLDSGVDGSHFGPTANRLIAALVREHLDVVAPLPAGSRPGPPPR